MQPGAAAAFAEGQRQRGLAAVLVQFGADGGQQRGHALAGQGRQREDLRALRGLRHQRLMRGGIGQVQLVPDLDLRGLGRDAKRGQDLGHIGGLFGGLGVADVADVQDQVGGQHLFQRGAEGGDQLRRQVRDETHGVRQDDLLARRQRDAAHRRVQRGEEHVLGQHLGPGQAVEQGGFPGVGIADQRDDGERHLGAGGAVQFARLHHLLKLALQLHHLLVDGAAVALDLRLTRAADEAEAAALAFKVGPGADKAGPLVGQRRQFHLQHALAGAGAVGEDLQDQAGAVEKLDAPFLFQIALLDRRDRAVHQHQIDLVGLDPGFQFRHLARAEQHPRLHLRQAHHLGPEDVQVRQRRGQADRLGQPVFGQAAGLAGAGVRVQHHGAGGTLGRVIPLPRLPFGGGGIVVLP